MNAPREPETKPLADLGWLVFHVVGFVLCHGVGAWIPYWGVFAFVELVGLLTGAPMTWTVRGWLAQGGRWRFGVVLAWSFWISGTFGFYAPLPLLVKGPIMIGFYLWLARHFRDNLRRSS